MEYYNFLKMYVNGFKRFIILYIIRLNEKYDPANIIVTSTAALVNDKNIKLANITSGFLSITNVMTVNLLIVKMYEQIIEK